MTRTDLDTLAAGLAGFFIYYSDAVDYMDGVKLTNRYAAAAAQAPIRTGL